jgi:predicted O-methyltransferase YrrM
MDRNDWKGWNELPKAREGNTGKYPKYQEFLFNLVRDLNPKFMLEIGFNAGHSACCFLNAFKYSQLYTFDICRWGTEYDALSVLREFFRVELIEGDSTKTLPQFIQDYPDITFDFIFVDGGHKGKTPTEDIKNSIRVLNKEGIIVIDDCDLKDVKKGLSSIDWGKDFEQITPPKIEKNIRVYKKL